MESFISDKYRKARGKWSRLLQISCKACGVLLFHYQKDGPGPLKRSYLDRIKGNNHLLTQEVWVYCPRCKVCLGFSEPYAKEDNRQAIRWAVEAVMYKITTLSKAKNC